MHGTQQNYHDKSIYRSGQEIAYVFLCTITKSCQVVPINAAHVGLCWGAALRAGVRDGGLDSYHTLGFLLLAVLCSLVQCSVV